LTLNLDTTFLTSGHRGLPLSAKINLEAAATRTGIIATGLAADDRLPPAHNPDDQLPVT
jgi:hypothetical protein